MAETSARSDSRCLFDLVRTEGLITAELGRPLRAHGLSPSSLDVLRVLDSTPQSMCPHEIGERLLITRGAVTALIDSLERQGLVRRAPHPEDRRMILVSVTERGRSLLDEVGPGQSVRQDEILAGLEPAEREQLGRLIAKLRAHLQARTS